MALLRDTAAPVFDELRGRVDGVASSLWLLERRVEDAHSLAFLQPLFSGRPLLPITGSALRPYCLAQVVNDILVNRRRRITPKWRQPSGAFSGKAGRSIPKYGVRDAVDPSPV